MDFKISHTVDADPETVAEALLDREFQASLADLKALRERKVLSQKKASGGLITRRIRCVLDVKISGTAKKFLGDGDPAWVEEATWHPEDLIWSWVIQPEVGGDLLAASGTISLQQARMGTERVVAGRVNVRVPFYGGKVEGWIVEGLKHSYAEEAERLSEWLT